MRFIFSAITVCALASVTAQADCAWVLWNHVTITTLDIEEPGLETETSWRVVDGYEAKTECSDAGRYEKDSAQAVESESVIPLESISETLRGYTVTNGVFDRRERRIASVFTTKEFVCLPEGVDPR